MTTGRLIRAFWAQRKRYNALRSSHSSVERQLRVARQELQNVKRDLAEAQQDRDALTGKVLVLEDQLGMMHVWRSSELAWHEAEAAIHAARKTRAIRIVDGTVEDGADAVDRLI